MEDPKKPQFTGLFSGEQSIISHAFLISVLAANEIAKPFLYLYQHLKNKYEQSKPSMFEEQELNDWYKYYKEYGTYPDYLETKYQEKYPNLRDIFLGKVKHVNHSNVDTAKKNTSIISYSQNRNGLFATSAPETDSSDESEEKYNPQNLNAV
ncbi:Uncharacterised protein [Legionella beliardensis]|uniref:Uncharacterized protein n=1 Tax=Legionella beliardensis TaxID=91822 RepID=A0A378ICB3_9GAMM|nr:hypothetical protein [Legionella beliardensis]STX29944.1 Uncharacterised protein [Legionella beliardensis]